MSWRVGARPGSVRATTPIHTAWNTPMKNVIPDLPLATAIATAYHDLYSPRPERQSNGNRFDPLTPRSAAAEVRLAELRGQEYVDLVLAGAEAAARSLAHFLVTYTSHCSGLGLGVSDVRDYIAVERQVLLDLFAECRQ